MLTSREIEYYYQTLLPGAASHEWVITEDIPLSMNNSELALPQNFVFLHEGADGKPFGYRSKEYLCVLWAQGMPILEMPSRFQNFRFWL